MEPYDYDEHLGMIPIDQWLEGPEEHVSIQLACMKCHGTAFSVMKGDYFTAVSCVKCGVPVGVHSG